MKELIKGSLTCFDISSFLLFNSNCAKVAVLNRKERTMSFSFSEKSEVVL
ncbi:hypothetical protein [Clostridium sp.]